MTDHGWVDDPKPAAPATPRIIECVQYNDLRGNLCLWELASGPASDSLLVRGRRPHSCSHVIVGREPGSHAEQANQIAAIQYGLESHGRDLVEAFAGGGWG